MVKMTDLKTWSASNVFFKLKKKFGEIHNSVLADLLCMHVIPYTLILGKVFTNPPKPSRFTFYRQ